MFNAEQLDSIPASLQAPIPVDLKDHNAVDEAEKLFAKSGANLNLGFNNYPCYSPMRDEIRMPLLGQFESKEEYYSTLFHELTHWTGNETRLKRFQNTKIVAFRSEEYSREELVAELGAAFVCSRLGISNDTTLRNSAAYLQGWMKFIKDDPKAFAVACQQAKKACEYIFQE